VQEIAESLTIAGDGVDIDALLLRRREPAPAVVAIHGWGGDAHQMTPLAELVHDAGFVALTISMRGWGASGGEDDGGLRQPDDVCRVVEWLGGQSFVRDRRVALLGVSQGGQVALLAAARGAPVAAVVAYAPVTDVDRWRDTTEFPGIPAYIDAVCTAGGTRPRSPVDFVAGIEVPVLLVHGDADTRVPTQQSVLFADARRAVGGDVELVLLPGVGHSRGPAGNTAAWDATLPFLRRHLG
jgi:dipeptidyl aminopeptidase/acylaminoacyl peptidase